jgi:predicted ATPase
VQDTGLLIESHRMLCNVFYFVGEPAAAVHHADCTLALYDPQQHRSLAFVFGQDPAVVCDSFAAVNLRILGYPTQALQRSQRAITYARELGHANSLGLALAFAAGLQGNLKNWAETLRLAEEAITLASEQGLVFWGAVGTLNHGWALIGFGSAEEGIALMRKGMAAVQATGSTLSHSWNLFALAQGCGHIEEGLELIGQGLLMVERSGERAWESELYRVKGDLLLQQFRVSSFEFRVSDPQVSSLQSPVSEERVLREVEACFLKAIEIARRQEAKMHELRATMSLARLWQQQGKHHEACSMLSAIYNWFTEGFDTVDLQEAKTLIEELSH